MLGRFFFVVYSVIAIFLLANAASAAQTTGIIQTVAGDGVLEWGITGDGGLATRAHVSPLGLALAPDGSLYIADSFNGHSVRRVGVDGVITRVAGGGWYGGYSGDGGPALQSRLTSPMDVALGTDGSIYIADRGNHRIRRIGLDGVISTVAGTGVPGFSGDGGLATEAQLFYPSSVAVGPDGSLYILDTNNYRIRHVELDGSISTIVGNGTGGYSGDGGFAIDAQINTAMDIEVAPDGTIYLADTWNQRIRKISPDGIIVTVAGTGTYGYNGDQMAAVTAHLNMPNGVAITPDGSIFIADTNNNRIRRVTADGNIITVAGNGSSCCLGGGVYMSATQAPLNHPSAVHVGFDGNLYISDWANRRVRRLVLGLYDPGTSSNSSPNANAGTALSSLLCSGSTTQIALDGSASNDPDGDPLTYTWTGPFGTATGVKPTVALGAGVHTITLKVSDGKGGTASASVQVTVTKDTTPPLVSAGSDVVLPLTGIGGTPYQLEYSAIDNCGPPAVTVSPSPLVFPLGMTQVTVTAVDGQGNSASDSATITVVDSGSGPTLGLPDIVELEATSIGGANFTIPRYVYDLCGCVHVYFEPALDTLCLGRHTVTLVAIDGAGNQIRRTITVVVKDSTPPVLSVPATVTLEGSGVFTPVNLSYQASDLYGVTVTSDAPADGFSVGSTVVTWTAVDGNGNVTTAKQTVTVTDTTAPTWSLPSTLTLEAGSFGGGGGGGGVMLGASHFSQFVHDACGEVTIHISQPRCSIGDNVVTVTACDHVNNCRDTNVTIVVRDTTAPTVIFENGTEIVYAEASGSSMAVTVPPPSVSDVSGFTLTSNAPAVFNKGETLVTWTAVDQWGNTSTATQKVIVRDTTPPVLELPPSVTFEATGPNGVPVDISRCPYKVSDSCGCGEVKVRVVTDQAFCPVGTHTMIIEACDQDGNCTQQPVDVTIKDTTAPTFTLNSLTNTLWAPNHKRVKIAEVTNIFDLVDANPRVDIRVASNEPLDDEGDGDTETDWEIVQNGSVWEVWVRAERSGHGSGRAYTIDVSVTDASGNTATDSRVVSVPHDMRDKEKRDEDSSRSERKESGRDSSGEEERDSKKDNRAKSERKK